MFKNLYFTLLITLVTLNLLDAENVTIKKVLKRNSETLEDLYVSYTMTRGNFYSTTACKTKCLNLLNNTKIWIYEPLEDESTLATEFSHLERQFDRAFFRYRVSQQTTETDGSITKLTTIISFYDYV